MSVIVPVTVVWCEPGAARSADVLVTADSPSVRAWAVRLGHEGQLGLLGRVETGLLCGDRVEVLDRVGTWSRVRIPGQQLAHPANAVIGWVPSAHLGDRADRASLVLTDRVGLVFEAPGRLPRQELSFGTELAIRRLQDGWHEVVMPAGPSGWLPPGTGLRPLGARGPVHAWQVLNDAARFLDVPYLWGGLSGHGVDCSGLTHLVHRAQGILIPRNAADQALVGEEVDPRRAPAGSLLFFGYGADENRIHHVALSTGTGGMLHAPRTGRRVELLATIPPAYDAELVSARSFVDPA